MGQGNTLGTLQESVPLKIRFLKGEKKKKKKKNHISSAESQKGANAVELYSIENQKGTIPIDFVER